MDRLVVIKEIIVNSIYGL